MRSTNDAAPPPSSVDDPNRTSTKRKTLYLIRHAESEENRRLSSLQNVVRCVLGLSWPSAVDVRAALELVDVSGQVDSPVSAKGRAQIAGMRAQLEAKTFLESRGVELVLHSPLQRAKDTCLGLFPPESIADDADPSRSTATARLSRSKFSGRIEETELLVEKTPLEWVFPSTFHARLQNFADHVQSRPESIVVAVGHSQFFRALLGVPFKFDNCDVWHVELSESLAPTPPPAPSLQSPCGGDGSSPSTTPQQLHIAADDKEGGGGGGGGDEAGEIVTSPPWSHLRRVYVCPKPSEPPSAAERDPHGDDDESPGVGIGSEKYSSSGKDKNA